MTTPYMNEESRKKWILIANRSGAKLFAADRRISHLTLVRAIPFTDGRKQNHEIDADDRGSRGSGAHGMGGAGNQQKHGLDRHEEATEHLANVFARELCEMLYQGRTRGDFDDAILVAEPNFLGRLRASLDKETSHRVVTTVNHNWIDLDEKTLREKLREAVDKADPMLAGGAPTRSL